MKINKQLKRPPLRHFGGKWLLAKWIIDRFCHHETYIEPCAGGLSVLLRKPRASREIVSDLNPQIINFWLMLRDRPDDLIAAISVITPHREIMAEIDSEGAGIQPAAQLYWQGQMSFNGIGTRWSTGTSDQRLQVVQAVHQKGFGHLWAASDRLQGVEILMQDCFKTIKPWLSDPSALIYFDPPYNHDSRKSKDKRYKNPKTSKPRRQYAVEMDDSQHRKINRILSKARCDWVLSGYPNKIYKLGDPLIKVVKTSDRLPAEECLWMPDRLKPGQQLTLFNSVA